MKIKKIDESGFVYSVEISEMDDLQPVLNPNKELKYDKIVLNYSKEMNCFYISTYYLNPLDSYGANWDVTDSGCFAFTKEELDQYIEELIKIRDQAKK